MQRDEGSGDRPDDPADGPAEGRAEGQAEADAWAAIVANFGERAVLDPDEEPPATGPAATSADRGAHTGLTDPPDADDDDADHEEDDALEAALEEEHRFVPPVPPPVPMPAPDRLAAWIGVFGSPAVLLVCLVAGVSIPTVLGWFLVVGFIGGFCYLLARTPGTPRDPWDDGSRV